MRSPFQLGFASIAAAMATCAGHALASPLDRSIVHADAKWLVHVDIEAGLACEAGRHMLDRMNGDSRHPFRRMSRDFGLDPAKDVKGVTVFGLPGQINDGIAIITTTSAADTMGDRLKESGFDGYQRTIKGDFVVHTWTMMHNRTFHAAVHAGRRDGERLVVLADSEHVLEQGMAAISGRTDPARPSLMPASEPQPGSILFATAGDLNAPGEPRPKAEILRAAKSLVIDVGQTPGQAGEDAPMFGDATIIAADEESAVKVQQMAQGVLAIIAMSAADKPEDQALVGDLVKGVTIKADGDRCLVESHHSAKTVAGVMDMMSKRNQEKRRRAENHSEPSDAAPGAPENADAGRGGTKKSPAAGGRTPSPR